MLGRISYKNLNKFMKEYSSVEKRVQETVNEYLKVELMNFKNLLVSIPYLRNFKNHHFF